MPERFEELFDLWNPLLDSFEEDSHVFPGVCKELEERVTASCKSIEYTAEELVDYFGNGRDRFEERRDDLDADF